MGAKIGSMIGEFLLGLPGGIGEFLGLIWEFLMAPMVSVGKFLEFTVSLVNTLLSGLILITMKMYEAIILTVQFQALQGFAITILVIFSGIKLYKMGILEDGKDVGYKFIVETLQSIVLILFGPKILLFILDMVRKLSLSIADGLIGSDRSSGFVRGISEITETGGMDNPILALLIAIVLVVVLISTLMALTISISKNSVAFLLLGFYGPFSGALSIFDNEYMGKIKAYTIKKSTQLFVNLTAFNFYTYSIVKLMDVYKELVDMGTLGSAFVRVFTGAPSILLFLFIILYSLGFGHVVSEISEALFAVEVTNSTGTAVNATKMVGKATNLDAKLPGSLGKERRI